MKPLNPVPKAVRYSLTALFLLSLLIYAGYAFTHYYEPGNIIYKRLKAEDEFVFENMRPEKMAIDPARFITVRSQGMLEKKRAALSEIILGENRFPTSRMPVAETIEDTPLGMTSLPKLQLIERLTLPFEVPFEPSYSAIFYHMRPADWNGRVVHYHHGYAGRFNEAQNVISRLLEAGYAVMAYNFYGYGEQTPVHVEHRDFGPLWLGYDLVLNMVNNPLRLYIEPVYAANNYLAKRYGITESDMLGFSSGGWVTTLVASTDSRIRNSFAVASLYPLYLRDILAGNDAPPPHLYAPLLKASNYLDMFALSATGHGRSYTQIFNRFDRCCYRNRYGLLYEEPVQTAVDQIGLEGQFNVLIDESHADHKISDWAFDKILEALQGQ